MEHLTYVVALVRDNLVWIVLVAIASLAFSPFQTWKLLSNNRPARGTGWKMWLADRYIQIWLARRAISSTDAPFALRMPTGLGDTTMDRKIQTKLIDEKLESYWLVRRLSDTVTVRKDPYILLCNWMTYILCRWFLTYFYGDSPKYYDEIATPASRLNQAISGVVADGLKRFIGVIAMLVSTFVILKIAAWAVPYIPVLLDPLLKHMPTPTIQIPTH